MRNFVCGIGVLVIIAALFFILFGKAECFMNHDDGTAYIKYIESMTENGLYPDIYGYGWAKE